LSTPASKQLIFSVSRVLERELAQEKRKLLKITGKFSHIFIFNLLSSFFADDKLI
jgi:hypothetical protein